MPTAIHYAETAAPNRFGIVVTLGLKFGDDASSQAALGVIGILCGHHLVHRDTRLCGHPAALI
jgi:hypothetical protein